MIAAATTTAMIHKSAATTTAFSRVKVPTVLASRNLRLHACHDTRVYTHLVGTSGTHCGRATIIFELCRLDQVDTKINTLEIDHDDRREDDPSQETGCEVQGTGNR
jgi:hypothetical protein